MGLRYIHLSSFILRPPLHQSSSSSLRFLESGGSLSWCLCAWRSSCSWVRLEADGAACGPHPEVQLMEPCCGFVWSVGSVPRSRACSRDAVRCCSVCGLHLLVSVICRSPPTAATPRLRMTTSKVRRQNFLLFCSFQRWIKTHQREREIPLMWMLPSWGQKWHHHKLWLLNKLY